MGHLRNKSTGRNDDEMRLFRRSRSIAAFRERHRRAAVLARKRNLKETAMKCDVCGNDYDKAFQIIRGGETGTFDSFECAVHAMAPKCKHCGCMIIGHGLEARGAMYCCANCA